MPRISQLPAKTTPASGDEIAIVEVATSTTKKITRADLLKGADLPNDTVTTGAIKNGAVTTNKIADSNVTTAKIANKAVTLPKINGGATAGLLKTDTSGNVTASTLHGSFHMNMMTYGKWAGNNSRYMDITFGVTLPVLPTVLATVWNKDLAMYGAVTTAVTNVTTTGCRIWINADINTNLIGVFWLAV